MKPKKLYTAIIVMSFLAVGTRPTLGITYSIPTDTSIGTWDGVNRIYTLNTDLNNDEIEIVEDGLTLDGNGHTLTGTYEYGDGPHGVYLLNRTGVTIKNLNIQNFKIGIRLEYSHYNVLTDITASNNWMSINLVNSNHNTVTGSAVSNNPYGFYVAYSDHNTVTGNTFWNNGGPMRLYYSSCSNTLANNSFSNNASGIWVTAGSNYTTLTGNTVNSNGGDGIFIQNSSNNTVIGNTITNNGTGIGTRYSHSNTLAGNTVAWNYQYGVHLTVSSDNQIYNNNFVDNETQAYVYLGSNNMFNLSGPEGGNYWSDWTRPDKNGDGIVDSPYVFFGGQDNLPWAAPNGWDLRIAREMLELLTEQVAALNLPKGFVGKLNDAAKVLTDANPNNNSAAGNKLNDFIDQVNNNVDKIIDAGGDPAALIDAAEAIIAMIEAG